MEAVEHGVRQELVRAPIVQPVHQRVVIGREDICGVEHGQHRINRGELRGFVEAERDSTLVDQPQIEAGCMTSGDHGGG